MKKKKLTIVIPTYNMEVYLRRCLDSLILNDGRMDLLEVLVINDGSKDSSSEIAHKYQDLYPNTFRVIDKENGNYGSCVNRGIDEANGVFFKILDADDWYDKNGLSLLMDNILRYEKDVDSIFTEFTYHNVDTGNNTKYTYKTKSYGSVYEIDEASLAGTLDECMLKMYSLTIKTDILKRINLRLDTGISYTDNEYMFFLYSEMKKVVFLNINVYQYFIGREGQTISPQNKIHHINDMYIVVQRMLDDYINKSSIDIQSAIECREFQIVSCALDYYDQLLGINYDRNRNREMKQLYKKIKISNSIKKKMLKKSPFFALWAFTGLYKSNRFVKPIWNIAQKIKK